jgi:hypothetical protein
VLAFRFEPEVPGEIAVLRVHRIEKRQVLEVALASNAAQPRELAEQRQRMDTPCTWYCTEEDRDLKQKTMTLGSKC